MIAYYAIIQVMFSKVLNNVIIYVSYIHTKNYNGNILKLILFKHRYKTKNSNKYSIYIYINNIIKILNLPF